MTENTLAPKPQSIVYLIKSAGSFYKVGTTTNLRRRLDNLQSGNPHPLIVVKAWAVADGYASENQLQELLDRYHYNLEWFKLPRQIVTELKAIEDLEMYLTPAA